MQPQITYIVVDPHSSDSFRISTKYIMRLPILSCNKIITAYRLSTRMILIFCGIRVMLNLSKKGIRFRLFYSLLPWSPTVSVYPLLFLCGWTHIRGFLANGGRCSTQNHTCIQYLKVPLSSDSRNIAFCRLAIFLQAQESVPPYLQWALFQRWWPVWKNYWVGILFFVLFSHIWCFWIEARCTYSRRSRVHCRPRKHRMCCTRYTWSFLSCWEGFLRYSLINLS